MSTELLKGDKPSVIVEESEQRESTSVVGATVSPSQEPSDIEATRAPSIVAESKEAGKEEVRVPQQEDGKEQSAPSFDHVVMKNESLSGSSYVDSEMLVPIPTTAMASNATAFNTLHNSVTSAEAKKEGEVVVAEVKTAAPTEDTELSGLEVKSAVGGKLEKLVTLEHVTAAAPEPLRSKEGPELDKAQKIKSMNMFEPKHQEEKPLAMTAIVADAKVLDNALVKPQDASGSMPNMISVRAPLIDLSPQPKVDVPQKLPIETVIPTTPAQSPATPGSKMLEEPEEEPKIELVPEVDDEAVVPTTDDEEIEDQDDETRDETADETAEEVDEEDQGEETGEVTDTSVEGITDMEDSPDVTREVYVRDICVRMKMAPMTGLEDLPQYGTVLKQNSIEIAVEGEEPKAEKRRYEVRWIADES